MFATLTKTPAIPQLKALLVSLTFDFSHRDVVIYFSGVSEASVAIRKCIAWLLTLETAVRPI
jgi:hypothetical protein